MLAALVRNWWMMLASGALAIVFGLVLLLSPRMPFDRLLVLFGVYAVLDGTWAIVAAWRTSPRLLAAWPIALGGAVSVGLGLLAIGWPFFPQRVLELIVMWGIVVGGLEIIGALLTPRATGCSARAASGRFFSLSW